MGNRRLTTGLAVLALAAMAAGCQTLPKMPTFKQTAPVCTDADIPIYFAEGSSELTGPARDVIKAAGKDAGRCTVVEVQVVGLADYKGPPIANLALSRLRAEHVAKALEDARLPSPTFGVIAAGEAGALTAKGDVDPLHRRAEIFIKYKK